MKLIYLVVILFISQYVDCRPEPTRVSSIFDSFKSQVNNFKTYIVAKGRSIENSFNNFKNNIIVAKNKTKTAIKSKAEWMRGRFQKYIHEAEKTGNKVFDAIVWEHKEYTCEDEDPAVQMTTPQLIASHGYHSEAHTVITDDGYILTLHRIPYPKNMDRSPRKTVLMHHGFLGSSADWILSGPEKGLAYILSNAGYDVWMANARGNEYSRAHIFRNADSYAFWNYSFHEISQYDLPKIIDYIMVEKNMDAEINYVGYSMGTTALFALLSTKPGYNHILRAGFALAPVAYMTNLESPAEILAKVGSTFEPLLKLVGKNELLPRDSVKRWLSKHSCKINYLEEALCENSLFILCGFNEKQLNRTLFPLILGHVPAGASTKTFMHFAQEIRGDGNFKQFDYGEKGNILQYGTIYPPEYPLSKITLPIALLSSEGDWLATNADVNKLNATLTNVIEHYVVPIKDFNHLDFLWANDAPRLVYDKLLTLMESKIN